MATEKEDAEVYANCLGEMEEIYTKCCNLIHAQNHYQDLEDYFPQSKSALKGWAKQFAEWRNRFITLLDCHVIGVNTEEHRRIFLAHLYADNPNQKVQVVTAQKKRM